MCGRGPGDCFGVCCVGRAGQLPELWGAVFAAAMSYTGRPGRVGVDPRVGRDGHAPGPSRARLRRPRGLDTALCAIPKWRRGPVASAPRSSRLGAPFLCAHKLMSQSLSLEALISAAGACGPWSGRLKAVSHRRLPGPASSDPDGPGRRSSGLGPSDQSSGSAAVASQSPRKMPQPRAPTPGPGRDPAEREPWEELLTSALIHSQSVKSLVSDTEQALAHRQESLKQLRGECRPYQARNAGYILGPVVSSGAALVRGSVGEPLSRGDVGAET